MPDLNLAWHSEDDIELRLDEAGGTAEWWEAMSDYQCKSATVGGIIDALDEFGAVITVERWMAEEVRDELSQLPGWTGPDEKHPYPISMLEIEGVGIWRKQAAK